MKTLIAFLLILFFPLGFGQVYAQRHSPHGKQGKEAIDSMLNDLQKAKEDTNKVKLLNYLSFTYYAVNPDEGVKYGQISLDLATKLGWTKGIARANSNIGVNYHFKSDFPKALEYYYKALKIYEDLGDKHGVASVTANIGGIYQHQGDFAKALECYFKQLKIGEESGDKTAVASGSGNIGSIYQLQKEYAKALNYNVRALQLDEETGNKYGIATSAGNIGQIYCEQKNYSAAQEYLQRSLKTAEEIGDQYLVAGNLFTIGSSYISLASDTLPEKTVTAKDELSTAKYLSNKQSGIKLPGSKAALLHDGIDYIEKARKMAGEIRAIDLLQYCDQQLAKAYRLTGDYKKALESSDNYRAIKDSVFSKENDEKLLKMSMQHDFDRKEAENRKEAALTLQRQKGYTYAGAAAVLLLLVFTFFITRNNKLLTKEKQRSEDLRKRSDDLLLNILPAEVAGELKDKGVASTKHFDNVTVLFTDFVNFTGAGERMSPQALIDELHTCFMAFDEITSKYGIEKIKTIGDAYLAVAGLPVSDPKHAENAVNAAVEINTFMQARLAKLGSKTFEVRIGIHSGSVVAGIVGVKKFAYDIWGDTVNTAARMEQNSEAGRINISETTYELVKDKFSCEYRGEIEAKNKGRMKMYYVG